MTELDRDEERRKRKERSQRLYEETSRWSSDQLRATFAQPERVEAAEKREREEREERERQARSGERERTS